MLCRAISYSSSNFNKRLDLYVPKYLDYTPIRGCKSATNLFPSATYSSGVDTEPYSRTRLLYAMASCILNSPTEIPNTMKSLKNYYDLLSHQTLSPTFAEWDPHELNLGFFYFRPPSLARMIPLYLSLSNDDPLFTRSKLLVSIITLPVVLIT